LWAIVTGKESAEAFAPDPDVFELDDVESELEEPQPTAVTASRSTEASRPDSREALVARGIG
jgi:hypothetical protein